MSSVIKLPSALNANEESNELPLTILKLGESYITAEAHTLQPLPEIGKKLSHCELFEGNN